MNIVNIIYSGLGGHASVVFAFIEGSKMVNDQHFIIFYGIESVPSAYIKKCEELKVQFCTILKNPGLDLQATKKLVTYLDKVKPSVILLHTVNLICYIKKFTFNKNIKLIAIEHQANELKSNKDWFYSILSMVLADKIVYLTETYRKQMKIRLGMLFQNKKISVINNGINLKIFKPKINSDNNEIINIGMLSRLMPTKDHVTLLEAFAEVLKTYPSKKIILNIAGNGSTMADLQDLTKKLNIEKMVNFLGLIPEEKSVEFLNNQNIYAHVSMGETMSTAIMQAMACRKTIVSSDVYGINNMIQNEVTGLLIVPKNKNLLKGTLIRLIDDKLLAARLATNAAKYAEEYFSNEKMFEKYETLFKE